MCVLPLGRCMPENRARKKWGRDRAISLFSVSVTRSWRVLRLSPWLLGAVLTILKVEHFKAKQNRVSGARMSQWVDRLARRESFL